MTMDHINKRLCRFLKKSLTLFECGPSVRAARAPKQKQKPFVFNEARISPIFGRFSGPIDFCDDKTAKQFDHI